MVEVVVEVGERKDFKHQVTTTERRPMLRMSFRRQRRTIRSDAASLSRFPGDERCVIPRANRRRERDGSSVISSSSGRACEATEGFDIVLRSKGVSSRWLSQSKRMYRSSHERLEVSALAKTQSGSNHRGSFGRKREMILGPRILQSV